MVILSSLKGYRLSNGLIGRLVRASCPLFIQFNTNTVCLNIQTRRYFLKKVSQYNHEWDFVLVLLKKNMIVDISNKDNNNIYSCVNISSCFALL